MVIHSLFKSYAELQYSSSFLHKFVFLSFDSLPFGCFISLQLIFPHLELDIKYYDLGVLNRDATDDKITIESAEATLK